MLRRNSASLFWWLMSGFPSTLYKNQAWKNMRPDGRPQQQSPAPLQNPSAEPLGAKQKQTDILNILNTDIEACLFEKGDAAWLTLNPASKSRDPSTIHPWLVVVTCSQLLLQAISLCNVDVCSRLRCGMFGPPCPASSFQVLQHVRLLALSTGAS